MSFSVSGALRLTTQTSTLEPRMVLRRNLQKSRIGKIRGVISGAGSTASQRHGTPPAHQVEWHKTNWCCGCRLLPVIVSMQPGQPPTNARSRPVSIEDGLTG